MERGKSEVRARPERVKSKISSATYMAGHTWQTVFYSTLHLRASTITAPPLGTMTPWKQKAAAAMPCTERQCLSGGPVTQHVHNGRAANRLLWT
jgi:hypothetical protein